jgi:hypothetical protein
MWGYLGIISSKPGEENGPLGIFLGFRIIPANPLKYIEVNNALSRGSV